jgi:hypothetical protein
VTIDEKRHSQLVKERQLDFIPMAANRAGRTNNQGHYK